MPNKINAESRALATMFYRDGVFEDRPCRFPIIDYRAFSNPQALVADVHAEALRTLVINQTKHVVCRDTAFLLAATNWRFHAIASAAIGFAPVYDKEVRQRLWMRIRLGCARMPQLVAAAAVADPEFALRSKRLLALRSTSKDSVAALSAVALWLESQARLREDPRGLASQLAEWEPNAGSAIAWHHAFSRLRVAA